VSYLNCASTDAKCLASLSTEDILGAADNVAYDIAYGFVDPAAGGGEQFRPVRDGTFITSPLDSTAAFLKQTKPLLITTVNKEAASTIYNGYTVPTTINNYTDAVDATYPTSSKQILSSSYYGVPASMQTQSNPDTRPQLEVLGTDGIWRCPSWTFARSWANAGGRAYVGEFAVGASYPGSGNSDLAACMQPGAVCHQDDIQIVFGTVNNPSAAQTKAITDVQARIAAFVKNGSPNTSPYPNWSPASSTNANAVQLGGNDSSVTVGGCTPNFWGDAVPYDYQVYGL
jgi:carboxylesterase type B